MILTSLIYVIADLCLDKMFDPLCSALKNTDRKLAAGDALSWIIVRYNGKYFRVKKAIVHSIDIKKNIIVVMSNWTGCVHVLNGVWQPFHPHNRCVTIKGELDSVKFGDFVNHGTFDK